MIYWILLALLVLLALVFLRALLVLLLAALGVCLAVAVCRALAMKPTAAKTAKPPVSDPERAKAYGEKLAEMVKIETVSSRFDPDRTKFRAFQEHLQVFPDDSDGKESACSAGDSGSVPGSGRSPGEGNDYPLQYCCLENPWTEEL